MHQADDQGASWKPMAMLMTVSVFLGMRVRMKMRRPVVMRVHVEMHFLAAESPQDIGSKSDEHDTDGELEPPRDTLGYDPIRQENDRADDEERQCVAQAPDGTYSNSADPGRRARRQAGERRDVIRLHGVTHAE